MNINDWVQELARNNRPFHGNHGDNAAQDGAEFYSPDMRWCSWTLSHHELWRGTTEKPQPVTQLAVRVMKLHRSPCTHLLALPYVGWI